MKNLEHYLRDPDIAGESPALREVHAIRLKIQDETKLMTPKERAENAASQAELLINQYKLQIRRPSNKLAGIS